MNPQLTRWQRARRRLSWDDWLFWFGVGGYGLVRAVQIGHWVLWLGVILMFGTGVAKLAGRSWAWHLGLIFLVLVLGWFGVRFALNITLWRGLFLAMGIYALWEHWKNRDAWHASAQTGADDADETTPPPVSLVLWLKESRHLDAPLLNQMAARAFGRPFDEGDDPVCFVVGEGPTYVLRTPEAWLMIHHFPRNYFNEPEKAAESIHELRRAECVRRHTAWLSVDMMRLDGMPGNVDVMPLIGAMLAELANEDVLAVYHPESHRVAPWDAAMKSTLAGGRPLEIFSQPNFVPVIQVPENDAALATAVAEARRRWPEFVAAFRASEPGAHFAIKAPVTEGGNTEFIWIEVKAVENGQIHGLLANDPVSLGELKIGALVSVPEADVNDWFYPGAENRPVGLFTVKAVNRRV